MQNYILLMPALAKKQTKQDAIAPVQSLAVHRHRKTYCNVCWGNREDPNLRLLAERLLIALTLSASDLVLEKSGSPTTDESIYAQIL